MILFLVSDEGEELGTLQMCSSDFTYIRNGNADWVSLTVEARARLGEFVINTFLENTPEPIHQKPPAMVLNFHQAGPGNWSPDR